MASRKSPKGPQVEHFRISIIDDMTHKQLWVMRFNRTTLFLAVISVITVIAAVFYSLVAYTPLRTFIPGYPDAHTKRAAINNALKIDSLQNVIYTWKFYTENLKKVMDGANPVSIDKYIGSGRKAYGVGQKRIGKQGFPVARQCEKRGAVRLDVGSGESPSYRGYAFLYPA